MDIYVSIPISDIAVTQTECLSAYTYSAARF